MNQKEKRPILIGFASQKGGVGKSSIAEVFASTLHYHVGVSVAAADCDGTQESFNKLRYRDIQAIKESESIKGYVSRSMKKAKGYKDFYKVISLDATVDGFNMENFLRSLPPVEVVIFDFPGHISDMNSIQMLLGLDYLLSPIEPDPQSLVSSFAFMKLIKKLEEEPSYKLKGTYMFWNKVNKSANPVVIDAYSQKASEDNIKILQSKIYHTIRIGKEISHWNPSEVVRCSFLPPSEKDLKDIGLLDFVNEILEIIGKKSLLIRTEESNGDK